MRYGPSDEDYPASWAEDEWGWRMAAAGETPQGTGLNGYAQAQRYADQCCREGRHMVRHGRCEWCGITEVTK